ncbi:hypothetical protein ACFYWS_20695 [Streptomyces sp. NPDC002795]|uniref:hypothetical protein n=1 Tax=Streptomyces sp. NPDC002795 TaxID=3364665 RepID=UPI0036BAA938
MDHSQRAAATMQVLRHTVDRDADAAMDLMAEIFAFSDHTQMYGVCVGLAEAAHTALKNVYGQPGPETVWALAAPDPGSGPQHPAHVFSLRFLAAYANGDTAMCRALFGTTLSAAPHDFQHSVIALLGDAARLVRWSLEERAAGQDEPAPHPH